MKLTEARMIDTLCRRYSCLPSQLMQEDASLMLHTLRLLEAAGDHEVQNGE